jgi:hypothetical protein
MKAKQIKAAPRKAKPMSSLPDWLTFDRVIIGGSVLATLAILIIVFVSSSQQGAVQNMTIEGVEEFTVVSTLHQVTPVDYPQSPPAGGPHHPTWQQCGVYSAPLVDEHAVHSLEHGAIWITYQPELEDSEVENLANITRQSSFRLLSPYPGIDSPIILTGWGVQLKLDSVGDPRLMQFLSKYEQGPNTPELGATCGGGVTQTRAELQGT